MDEGMGMVLKAARRGHPNFRRTLCFFALIMSTSSFVYGQDTEKQLQQLKEQLETTTKQMEERISAVEQQLEKEKEIREQKAVSGEQVAAVKQSAQGPVVQVLEKSQKALLGDSNNIGAKFQGQLPSEPTYDLLREADEKIEKLQEREGSFEFHGYFRSGFGLNSHGGQQIAFEAAGAQAKYRL